MTKSYFYLMYYKINHKCGSDRGRRLIGVRMKSVQGAAPPNFLNLKFIIPNYKLFPEQSWACKLIIVYSVNFENVFNKIVVK